MFLDRRFIGLVGGLGQFGFLLLHLRRHFLWGSHSLVIRLHLAACGQGEEILKLFGVEVASLEVAGGLIIALVAMSMLYVKQDGIHGSGLRGDEDALDSIAVVPLAMPLVAGPGAIATVIVNTKTHQGIEANLQMSLVCVGMSVVIVVCFLSAGVITRLLGPAGMNLVTKFMGLILLAIAVGMFASGAKGLLPGLV